MLHLISQQLWKLLLFSSGKKASVETLSFLFIKTSPDFFWCSLKCQPTGAKRWLTFQTITPFANHLGEKDIHFREV